MKPLYAILILMTALLVHADWRTEGKVLLLSIPAQATYSALYDSGGNQMYDSDGKAIYVPED